ncbi:MAG: hypothetical protein R2791_10820 [Saprospiraceae bacterium]
MKPKTLLMRAVFLPGFAVVLCIFFHSCFTVAGFLIGSSIDKRQPAQDMDIQGWEVHSLKKNARITVYPKVGKPVKGNYRMAFQLKAPSDTSVTEMIVESHTGLHRFRLDQIDHIFVPGRTSKGRVTGGVVGLVIDAGLLVIAVSSTSFDLNLTLCPHVYSYDGAEYHLDAEICSGSFYKEAQVPDRVVLPHLQADANGIYRVKLANEMQESDYIDQVNLLVFDHLADATVYPTRAGRYLALTRPQAPLSAHSSKGSDMRALLSDREPGSCWIGNPFAYDPDRDTCLREQLELTFDKPAGAVDAALLLNLCNTKWAATQQMTFMSLQEQAHPGWYTGLDAEQGAALKAVLIRENGLAVSVWDGIQWKEVGQIDVVGPAAERSELLEIDLQGLPDGVLKVRLDCPPGYWMVNSAQVDFSYEEAVLTKVLQPVGAHDQHGRNVMQLLGSADGKCHVMPEAGNYVELHFEVPSPEPHTGRTLVLQCDGYYSPHLQAGGEPQTELAGHLLKPGAFNKWRLQALHRQTERAVAEYSR